MSVAYNIIQVVASSWRIKELNGTEDAEDKRQGIPDK